MNPSIFSSFVLSTCPLFKFLLFFFAHVSLLVLLLTPVCLGNTFEVHFALSFRVFAVDIKLVYEYVCWRSKNIAYGEPLCIMQPFLSRLHLFRRTHIHTITCTAKQGYKSPLLPPSLTPSLLKTDTHKVT